MEFWSEHIGKKGASWPCSYDSWIYNYLCNQCLSPLMLWVESRSGRARCTTLCDKVCQWLGTDRWFSSGPPVFSTNKADRNDITEILLKAKLKTNKQTHILEKNKVTQIQCAGKLFLKWRLFNITSGSYYLFSVHKYNFSHSAILHDMWNKSIRAGIA